MFYFDTAAIQRFLASAGVDGRSRSAAAPFAG
jgi:hypothetical protein